MQIDRSRGGLLTASFVASVLAFGVLIGLLLDRSDLKALFAYRGRQPDGLPTGLVSNAAKELQVLDIRIPEDGMRALAQSRARALARGQIVHSNESEVDAVVSLGKDSHPARVRIKGDWIDHVSNDKVSLRIAVQGGGTIMGMSEFSIQHPKTRGYLAEWLVLETARKAGILTPRCGFVTVNLNGGGNGIYFLEEHFNKEMLESQQRREGPIMRFDEDALWSYRADTKAAHSGNIMIDKDITVDNAVISAYGSAKEGPLAMQYNEAFAAMRAIQQAHSDWRTSGGRTIDSGKLDEHLDISQTAKTEALMRVFNTWHGLIWHNLRFYYNAVTARIEPVVFDSGAREAGLPFDDNDVALVDAFNEFTLCPMFMCDQRYATAYYEALAAYTAPEFIAEVEASLGRQLDQYARVMSAEGILPPEASPDVLLNSLRTEAQRIRETTAPTLAAMFSCTASPASDGSGDVAEVEAWAATRIPAVLMGFRFANGRFVPASQTVDAAERGLLHREDGSVVLPTDQSRKVFRLPLDPRLSGLIEIKQVKDAAKAGMDSIPNPEVQAYAVCRAVTCKNPTEVPLKIRHVDAAWAGQRGRPSGVTVEQTLAAHPYLAFDQVARTLTAPKGQWDVKGDLVVPDGVRLVLGGGVTLRFDPKAVVLTTSSVQFAGTADEPVVLECRESGRQWGGLTVLEAAAPSLMKFVRVIGTMRPSRGGWIHTGAVNFFRSDVRLEDCVFEDSHAEDALNVIRAAIHIERCKFSGAKSDLFDGDFVKGLITDCEFRDSVGDAVDVSGSDVVVENCRFIDVNDKSLSVGERSTARIRSCVTEFSGIGIAVKDGSTAEVYDYTLKRARFFGLAAYVKKPEIGPAKLVITGSSVGECGRSQTICQTGSSILIDGEPVAPIAFDVDAMYQSEVLGSNPWGKKW